MGSASGGGGYSKSSQNAGISNPVGAVLANLFGIPVTFKKGSIRYVSPNDPRGQYLVNPSFGQESFGGVSQVANIQNPLQGLVAPLAGLGVEGLLSGQNTLNNYANPTLQDLLSTGSPVDTTAAVNQAITNVSEQLAPSTGAFSTDLMNEALRQASQLNVGAQEAAKGRQVEALGLAPLLASAQSNLPANAATQNLTLGEELRRTDPAARQLDLLLQLAGVNVQPVGTGSSKSANQHTSLSYMGMGGGG